MIRVVLPAHLRTLARADREVAVRGEGPVTQRAVLDPLEAPYPPAAGEPYPPAIAPTTSSGSAPAATASGSGASGEVWDRSCSQAKNLTNGRRRFVTWSRIVPRSAG